MVSGISSGYIGYLNSIQRVRSISNNFDNSENNQYGYTDTVRISNQARELFARTSGAASIDTGQDLSDQVSETEETSSSRPDIWSAVASKYNIHQMTMEEMADMSLELYQNGAITFFDHAIMSFDGRGVAGDSFFLSEMSADGSVDWISEYKERISQAEKLGDGREVENLQRILSHLQKLDA